MEPATGPHLDIDTKAPPTAAGTSRKTRSDAKLEQLSPARRERLRVWLEDENRSYAEVVYLLRAEFNLTVGKSAVSLYWRRHLLPRRHEEEAEIAATLAALPSADFDTATLNQARALAWTALARPFPHIQDAARLLALIHRSERLTISRQRLALEERRLALREAFGSEPKALSKPCLDGASYPAPQRDIGHERTPARHQPSEPRLPLRSLGEGGPRSPEPLPVPSAPDQTLPATPPRFPGYSGLFLSPEGPEASRASPPFAPFPCLPCVPWATPPGPSPPPQQLERHAPR